MAPAHLRLSYAPATIITMLKGIATITQMVKGVSRMGIHQAKAISTIRHVAGSARYLGKRKTSHLNWR